MSEDPMLPYDAGEEGHVKARKRKSKAAAMERANDLLWIMGHPQGRRVMWNLWAEAGVGKISFDAMNPYLTAFQEGSRNLGQKLLAEIQTLCPELYLRAMAEANETKKEDEANG